MLSILHISDLHFGPPYVERVGEALLQTIERLQLDLIVASGDFTQRAKSDQFQQARAWLDRLPDLPTIVCPGNHDVPLYRVHERLGNPHALYRKYIHPELNYSWRGTGAAGTGVSIVSLDSTAPRHAITNGRIRQSQLDFAGEAFAQADPNDLRIVVAHHHFAPAPDYEGGEVMPKAKRAIDEFTRMRVDLILGGHLHRGYLGHSNDVYPGEDREHGIIIVQSGTSTSRRGRVREREKNSFNLIHVDDKTVRVTHWMYFDDENAFRRISGHLFPRAGQRFFPETDWPWRTVELGEAAVPKTEGTGP